MIKLRVGRVNGGPVYIIPDGAIDKRASDLLARFSPVFAAIIDSEVASEAEVDPTTGRITITTRESYRAFRIADNGPGSGGNQPMSKPAERAFLDKLIEAQREAFRAAVEADKPS